MEGIGKISALEAPGRCQNCTSREATFSIRLSRVTWQVPEISANGRKRPQRAPVRRQSEHSALRLGAQAPLFAGAETMGVHAIEIQEIGCWPGIISTNGTKLQQILFLLQLLKLRLATVLLRWLLRYFALRYRKSVAAPLRIRALERRFCGITLRIVGRARKIFLNSAMVQQSIPL